MTIIGNILLVIASIFSIMFFKMLTEASRATGERAMGYIWGIIILSLFMTAAFLIISILIHSKGGFLWINASNTGRNALVFLGLISIMVTVVLSALFKTEPVGAVSYRYLTGIVPVLFPILLIGIGAILLNENLKNMIPIAAYKYPLVMILGVSILSNTGGLIEWFISEQQNAAQKITSTLQAQDENRLRVLKEIEEYEPKDGILSILSFTGRYWDEDIKGKAVVKIKSDPRWEETLLEILNSDSQAYAFTFMDAHDVDHKELFIEPLNNSIKRAANEVRKRIKEANDLQDWHFEHMSLDRMLGTVDKFKNMGVDFRPAIQDLRNAFDVPFRGKKFRFNITPAIDVWLKKNVQ
jgi:uncharacterized protein YwgA